jgi:REP element-mobilizing transposase RayT
MKKQLELNLDKGHHGGKRKGAGRKRTRSRGVAHEVRQKVNGRVPLHVNFKYRIYVRNKQTLKLLKRAIENARSHGLKVLHYSFQHNHVHLIIEAMNNQILTRGMRSLTNTMAKGIDRGRIQIERYHLHILKTRAEIRNATHYVLFNEQKHGNGICSTISDYSSLLNMPNWRELVQKFVKKRRITIKIERGGPWRSDPGCYLYEKSLHHDHTSRT